MTMSTRVQQLAGWIAGLLCATLLLTACGGTAEPGDSDSAGPGSEGAPVSLDTAYGEITVDKKPKRIVALGGRHLELLTLLGEKPVAFADYGSDKEQMLTSYPWLEGTIEGEPDLDLFTAEYQPAPEAIAALEPDLILTTIWQTDEKLYKQLSQIAPTYVGIEADTNTEWQDDLAALAKLTGHDEGIVADAQGELDAALESAAERLPGLQDKSFYIAALGDGDQLWLTEYAAEPAMALGLKPGEGQPVNGEEAADAPKYSQENIDQLTADVVLIAAENRDPSGAFRAALEADPRLAELPASKNGTMIFLATAQWNAVNGGTAASQVWWLNQIVPVLEESTLNQSGQ